MFYHKIIVPGFTIVSKNQKSCMKLLILSGNVVPAQMVYFEVTSKRTVFRKTYRYCVNSAEYLPTLCKPHILQDLNISLRGFEDLDLDCMVLFSITDKVKRAACLSYRMAQHRLRKCSHRRIHCISLYIFHHCGTGYHSCYNVQDSQVQLLVLSLLSLPGQGPFHSTVMNGCIPKILSAWMLFHLKINLQELLKL